MPATTFTYHLLHTLRWEVKFGEMSMAIFGTRDEAQRYCARKNGELNDVK